MPGDLFVDLLHPFAVATAWAVVIQAVSTAYAVTMERFDHSNVWKQETRLLLESRNRTRL